MGTSVHPPIIAAVDQRRQIQTLYRGAAFDVDLITWTGREGAPVEKIAVRHRGAVAVIPELPDGRLVLIRNHRATLDDWLVEFCAGGIGPGEAPVVAARRELAEETGYVAGRIESLAAFVTTPGFSDELMQVFVATQLEPGPPSLEPDERIEVLPMTPEAVAVAIRSGEIRDGKTIAAFHLWRERRRETGAAEEGDSRPEGEP
ncbi:MAG: NUDIX hydrolase [Phycisphaerales bacterium]|jgi:ADP-ribose pyrophosphatase